MAFLFTKKQRLLAPKEFKKVLDKPLIKVGNSAIGIYAIADDFPRLGLAIARKHIKKSVHRNALKRIFRESFRLNYASLPKMALVVMSRPALQSMAVSDSRPQLEFLWESIKKYSLRP